MTTYVAYAGPISMGGAGTTFANKEDAVAYLAARCREVSLREMDEGEAHTLAEELATFGLWVRAVQPAAGERRHPVLHIDFEAWCRRSDAPSFTEADVLMYWF